jgi:hypothetical protein
MMLFRIPDPGSRLPTRFFLESIDDEDSRKHEQAAEICGDVIGSPRRGTVRRAVRGTCVRRPTDDSVAGGLPSAYETAR